MLKRPKVCQDQENIPHHYSTNTRPNYILIQGSIQAFMFTPILTLSSKYHSIKHDSSDQATLFPILSCCPVLSCEWSLCLILSWQEHQYALSLWVTVAFLFAESSLTILLWPLASTRHFLTEQPLTVFFFSFSDWKLQVTKILLIYQKQPWHVQSHLHLFCLPFWWKWLDNMYMP